VQRFTITPIFLLFYIFNLQGQWEVLNEGFKGSVTSVDFIDNDTGWLSGRTGMFFKTNDGGLTWRSIPLNEEWDFWKIDFSNEINGWAICQANNVQSALVLKTEDGGDNWTIKDQQPDIWYNDIQVLSDNVVFVASDSVIKKTINGALSWIDISPEPIDGYYYSIRFFSNEIGLAAGVVFDNGFNRGLISRTVNGGSSWDEIIISEFNSISNLQFAENAVGYFIAENWEENRKFYLCRTRDLGQNREIILQSQYPINSYFLSNNNVIYVSVSDSLYNTKLLKSLDSGRTWNSIFSLPNWQTAFINLDEEDKGVIIVQLFSPMGGRSSEQLILSNRYNNVDWLTRHFSYNLTDVCFINPNLGFTAGGYSIFHGPTGGDIFSSNDGGLTWLPVHTIPAWITSIEFASESVGYVMTQNWPWLIFKTTDAGMNWQMVYENNFDSTGFEFSGNDIFMSSEDKLWAAGNYWKQEEGGAGVFHSTDGGTTWDFFWIYPNDEITWYNLNAIHVINNQVWSVGNNGFIVRITNADTFQVMNYSTDLPLNEILFLTNSKNITSG